MQGTVPRTGCENKNLVSYNQENRSIYPSTVTVKLNEKMDMTGGSAYCMVTVHHCCYTHKLQHKAVYAKSYIVQVRNTGGQKGTGRSLGRVWKGTEKF